MSPSQVRLVVVPALRAILCNDQPERPKAHLAPSVQEVDALLSVLRGKLIDAVCKVESRPSDSLPAYAPVDGESDAH